MLQAKRRPILLSLLSCLVLVATGCAGGSQAGELAPETIVARDRAADMAARARWAEALETLKPLAQAKDAALEDLLRAANAQLAIKEADDRAGKARPWVERAKAQAPDDPRVLWCEYRLAAVDYDTRAALELLRKLYAKVPDDATVLLALASTLDELDEAELEEEARELYAKFLAIPAEQTGSWRMTALYRLAQSLIKDDRVEESQQHFDEMTVLEARGVTRPGVPEHEPDTLGAVKPHTPGLFELPPPVAPTTKYRKVRLAEGAGLANVLVVQLSTGATQDLGAASGADREELYSFEPRASVVAFGASGVFVGAASGELARVHAGAVHDAVPLDRFNAGAVKGTDLEKKSGDRDLDLVLSDGSGVRLLENVGGTWTLAPAAAAELGGPALLLESDYDHDGDLDVVVCTARGARILRNDGLDGSGGLTEAGTALPAGVGADWRVVPEDFDRHNDVDYLFLAPAGGGAKLAMSRRGGNFADESASLPALAGGRVVAADFDADSWPDLALVTQSEVILHTRTQLGAWTGAPKRIALSAAPTGAPVAVDLDLDGALDLVWPLADAPAGGLLAPGFANGGVAFTLGERFASARTGPAVVRVADLDGDRDHDLVRLDTEGLVAHLAEGAGDGLVLALQGHKDNARGSGAVLELRSGLRYQRRFWRGQPELVGSGGKPLDVVRVSWPNGIVQGIFGVKPGADRLVAQRIGLVGSCPFLYTWNGTTYEFVSDVLGITPLGLPMAPGMLVPPDHDEFVLVKGEQLVPKDGVYELQFTEELREVTYLDRLRLDVLDHPAEVEVFPNERFSFPPFPEHHLHTVRDALVPLRALDQAGQDWAAELARDERRFAVPFERQTEQYTGLATPHVLELAFDPARVRDAAKLRLFLNGWFYWTDASVNMAAATHPDVEFVPPLLSVPDGNGGWKECGPIGFPAGKLKTMAVDVTALLNRDDPRVRLFSTLRLYWDSIRLATDADDAPVVTTSLEPLSADLWQRGFSRTLTREFAPGHFGEWFEWDARELFPRWNQHPGLYTKLGETLPLVTAIDDQFVIMGAGDALTVRFDAKALPPLPSGWRRDYLVFLDGWAKDRDPNTHEALYVEPLPFHGMSGYPYGPDERFPDGPEHRVWRREWNTRPATRWITPLSAPEALAPALD
jgi:hypothetical protein